MPETCITSVLYEHELHEQSWVVLNETSTQTCFKPLNVLVFDLVLVSIVILVAYFTYRFITIKNIL